MVFNATFQQYFSCIAYTTPELPFDQDGPFNDRQNNNQKKNWRQPMVYKTLYRNIKIEQPEAPGTLKTRKHLSFYKLRQFHQQIFHLLSGTDSYYVNTFFYNLGIILFKLNKDNCFGVVLRCSHIVWQIMSCQRYL
jgi:hypothetical protein